MKIIINRCPNTKPEYWRLNELTNGKQFSGTLRGRSANVAVSWSQTDEIQLTHSISHSYIKLTMCFTQVAIRCVKIRSCDSRLQLVSVLLMVTSAPQTGREWLNRQLQRSMVYKCQTVVLVVVMCVFQCWLDCPGCSGYTCFHPRNV